MFFNIRICVLQLWFIVIYLWNFIHKYVKLFIKDFCSTDKTFIVYKRSTLKGALFPR